MISSLIVYSSLPEKSKVDDPFAFEKCIFPDWNPNGELAKKYLTNKREYFKNKEQLKQQGLIQSGKWVSFHQGKVLITGDTYADVMVLPKEQGMKDELTRLLPHETYKCKVDFEEIEKPTLPRGKRYVHVANTDPDEKRFTTH